MNYDSRIFVNKREVSIDQPTYFIADIGANHDGDISRAKDLISLAKEAGADVAKLQHFLAPKIVSDYGFKNLGSQLSHQASWKKTVYEIYKDFECKREWTQELVLHAKQVGIELFTSPYDFDAIDLWDEHVAAYKIGSGDVTWIHFIELVAKRDKPVIIATGAADIFDVERAVDSIVKHNSQIVLMQCNTNYTGSSKNYRYINLNVLKTYATKYPGMVLGLSDHTNGHATVLGAVALGARVIEKHFTDNNDRVGPDHGFAMNPATWREMVARTRELEAALGDGIKKVEDNEKDTIVVQRRCARLKRDMSEGEIITEADVEFLRPAPTNAVKPYEVENILGKKVSISKVQGDALFKGDIC